MPLTCHFFSGHSCEYESSGKTKLSCVVQTLKPLSISTDYYAYFTGKKILCESLPQA